MTVITPGTVPADTVFYTGECERCHAVIRATSWECSLLNLLVLPPQRRHECPTCGSQIIMTDGNRTVRVIINGRPRDIESPVSYESIISLAGLTGNPTATYFRGREGGVISPGTHVSFLEGTVFTVAHTGAA